MPMPASRRFTLVELLAVVGIIGLLLSMLLPVLQHAREKARQTYCANNLREITRANLLYHDDYGMLVAAAADFVGANLTRWHGRRPATNYHVNFDYRQAAIQPYLGANAPIKRCPTMEAQIEFNLPAYEKGGGGYGYNQCIGSRIYFEDNPWSAAATGAGLELREISRADTTVMFTDTACFVDAAGNHRTDATTGRLAENPFTQAPFFILNRKENRSSSPSPTIHFRHLRASNVAWVDGHLSTEPMAFSDFSNWSEHGLGWFGPDDNSLFDPF